MSKPNGLSGIINYGNSCYMNTALQCLSNIPSLRDFFLNKIFLNDLDQKKNECDFTIEFYKIILALWNKNCIIRPNSFKKEIMRLVLKTGSNINFLGNNQNDVQEFLLFILNNLHNSLSKKVNMKINGKIQNEMDIKIMESMKLWKSFYKDDYSIIIKLFYSQQVSYIYDLNNNLRSTSYQPVCYYTLPINDRCNNIYECLNLYADLEVIETKYYDENTKENIDAKKKISLWTTPEILIIVFKRFTNNKEKIDKDIDFPIDNLNLNKYCVGYDRNTNVYNLIGICNHIGNLNFGHYYSYVLNSIDKKWYEINDTNISLLDKNNINTENAYCLFYQKI